MDRNKRQQTTQHKIKRQNSILIPGGKRDEGENDKQTLIREIKEELSVDIMPDSINYMGTYNAQADDHKKGIIVKMTCYTAEYSGDLATANEIEEMKWIDYNDYDKISYVDKVIFDHLHFQNRI